MAALFLTTAALHIYLVSRTSRLGQAISNASVPERWVSPLSHAILRDSYLVSEGLTVSARKAGLRAVEQHRHAMMRPPATQYPLPDHEALRIWSETRGLEVNIPTYDDGVGSFPAQRVGPDELLVYATAAALAITLIGPKPEQADVLEFLAGVGIKFADF